MKPAIHQSCAFFGCPEHTSYCGINFIAQLAFSKSLAHGNKVMIMKLKDFHHHIQVKLQTRTNCDESHENWFYNQIQ